MRMLHIPQVRYTHDESPPARHIKWANTCCDPSSQRKPFPTSMYISEHGSCVTSFLWSFGARLNIFPGPDWFLTQCLLIPRPRQLYNSGALSYTASMLANIHQSRKHCLLSSRVAACKAMLVHCTGWWCTHSSFIGAERSQKHCSWSPRFQNYARCSEGFKVDFHHKSDLAEAIWASDPNFRSSTAKTNIKHMTT